MKILGYCQYFFFKLTVLIYIIIIYILLDFCTVTFYEQEIEGGVKL